MEQTGRTAVKVEEGFFRSVVARKQRDVPMSGTQTGDYGTRLFFRARQMPIDGISAKQAATLGKEAREVILLCLFLHGKQIHVVVQSAINHRRFRSIGLRRLPPFNQFACRGEANEVVMIAEQRTVGKGQRL